MFQCFLSILQLKVFIMKFKLCLALAILSFINCSKPTIPLVVGTYTNGDSEGIYQLTFNTDTGILSNKKLVATSSNPSFITYSPNKKYVYSVNEDKDGTISSFKVEKNGSLSFLNKVSANGAHPCHIAIDKSGEKVVVSNYTSGTVSIHSVLNDGHLSEASQVFNHTNKNEPSHAHSAQFFKDQLYVADLGRNAVYNYQLNNKSYILKDSSIIRMNKKNGPRHFSISKNGEFLYIINEHGNSITSVQKTKDGYQEIDSDSTLSNDYKKENSCADIHLSKDERFVYASNRGENSIAVFKRDLNTGTLTKIQNSSVHGNWPRNFTLDPTGKFLLAGNQYSNNITVFRIDSSTGKLTFLHSYEITDPVCLLF